MSMLTFRNSQGVLVDIPTVAATQVKNEFGAILDKAIRGGAVAIDNLGVEFDELLDRMQSSNARKAMDAAFNASPAKLGRAAVKAARKGR
jgi:antitoxin Phd